MKNEITLNEDLFYLIMEIAKDLIESTMEDEPDLVPVLLTINSLLSKLDMKQDQVINLFSETLINKIFEEVKICI